MTHIAQGANSSLISRKILFSNPDKTCVSLSHDGKYVSYIAPLAGVLNLFIAPIDKPLEATPITQDKGRGVRIYYWAYDNQHIIYAQDEQGDENFRFYSVNILTNKTKLLTPSSGVKSSLYAMSHRLPNTILIGLNERDKRYFDIYKIDLLTGNQELVLENNKFTSFVIDEHLKIRFGQHTNQDGDVEYYQFKHNDWSMFMKVPMTDTMTTYFLSVDKTGNTLYMLDSRDRNTGALKTLDLKTGKTSVLAEDKRADIDIFTTHPTEDIIQAVTVNYDKISYKVLDDSIKADMKYLQSLDNSQFYINTRTLDDRIWLVAYSSDTSPVKYYKYDRTSQKATYLFSNKKELEKCSLAAMLPIIIKARDGLDLVSYLTLPDNLKLDKNLKLKQPLPLVLYVHGGPWARDSWGLNLTHQWLANRGYAALSVNYRGSTGFGKNFVNAGNRQWGKKMHDDLIDAVNWTVKHNIADPTKVAIMGGSYGGYATLVGLTLTPDVFACGVDLVGPSNILTLINSIPPYWEPIVNDFKKRVGATDSEEDLQALAAISPLTYVSQIKKPLFIAQGAHDPRVKRAESDQIVKAMQDKNIPVVYALYADEGHGFVRPENKLSYFAMVEHFLAKVLGGRAEAIGKDLQGANCLVNGIKPTSLEAEKLIDQVINR